MTACAALLTCPASLRNHRRIGPIETDFIELCFVHRSWEAGLHFFVTAFLLRLCLHAKGGNAALHSGRYFVAGQHGNMSHVENVYKEVETSK